MLAAVRLFELGRLSYGHAAQLAGISRVELLMRIGSYQVSPSPRASIGCDKTWRPHES